MTFGNGNFIEPEDQLWLDYVIANNAYPLDDTKSLNPVEISNSSIDTKKFEVVVNELLIDVTDTCNFNIRTGIQRVVRNLVKELVDSEFEFRLVTWNAKQEALRELSLDEVRVATGQDLSFAREPSRGLADPEEYKILIPLDCKILIPELATQTLRVMRTIEIAKSTSNQIFMIGYDAVPVLLPDTTSDGMVSAFTLQLEIMRQSEMIFGISESTSNEYRALNSGLSSRGSKEPIVTTVALPIAPLETTAEKNRTHSNEVKFLVVGSHEPRKNHERVLAACEILWNQGYQFEIHFVGNRGWNSQFFWELLRILQQRGRKIFVHIDSNDSELIDLYKISSALLSFSLHEGYGLPIAEAAAMGLQTLTVRNGSQGELANLAKSFYSSGNGVLEISECIRTYMEQRISGENGIRESPSIPFDSWADYSTKIISEIIHH